MWHFSIRTLSAACIVIYLVSANFDLCHSRPRRIRWGVWRWPRLPPKSPFRRPPSVRHRIPSPPAWSPTVAPARRYRRSPSIRPFPFRLPPPAWSPTVAPDRKRPLVPRKPPAPPNPQRPKGDSKGVEKTIFSVMDYGAKGDGQESDTKVISLYLYLIFCF